MERSRDLSACKNVITRTIKSLFLLSLFFSSAAANAQSEGYIYIALPKASVVLDHHIKRVSIRGGDFEPVLTIAHPSKIMGMAVDEVSQKIFWSQYTYGANDCSVWSANLDGSNPQQIVGGVIGGGNGMAVDSLSGKIYLSHSSGGCTNPANGTWLHKFNFDGSGIEPLAGVPNDLRYGMVADPLNDKLYMVRSSSYWKHIERSGLDGSGHEILIDRESGEVFSARQIDLDLISGRFYWANANGSIKRANLDGSNIEEVISVTGDSVFTVGVQVDSESGILYWSQRIRDVALGWSSAQIWKSNLDGSDPELVGESATTDVIPTYIALVTQLSDDADGDGVIGSNDLCPDEDASGYDFNTDGCIDTPEELIEMLIIAIESLSTNGVIGQGDTKNLINPLLDVLRLLESGNYRTAHVKLKIFIKKIEWLVSKGKLTEAEATPLIDAAKAVRNLILM